MHASDTGELSFEDVRVPADAVLGEVGKGFYHIAWELQGERLVAAAGCHAGAERMIEKTIEYAKEREAFGRPIGKFQALRHKIAEMATKTEAAKQFTYATAWRFANGEYPVREITMAKLYASRICCEVADDAVQILGGYGYMKEYEIERAYRDVRLNRIGAGTDEVMLDVIGRSYGLRIHPRTRTRRRARARRSSGDPCADRGDEVAYRSVSAALDPLRGQLGKPALDLVQPRAAGPSRSAHRTAAHAPAAPDRVSRASSRCPARRGSLVAPAPVLAQVAEARNSSARCRGAISANTRRRRRSAQRRASGPVRT